MTRKKDKKPSSTSGHASKDSFSSTRGDFRGGRGGRGGRVGPGRGGAVTRSRGGLPRGAATNGHTHRDSAGSPQPSPAINQTSTWAEKTATTTDDKTVDASSKPDAGAWATTDSHDTGSATSNSWSDQLETPSVATPTSWATPSTTSTWGGSTDVNGSTSSMNLAAAPGKVSKTPATSKMSWAQIARSVGNNTFFSRLTLFETTRPQEKPTPPPSTVAPAPPLAPVTVPPPVPESEPEATQQHLGWEEPTTVQPPTWDDEPPTGTAKLSTSAADVWSSAIPTTDVPIPSEEPKTEQQQESPQVELEGHIEEHSGVPTTDSEPHVAPEAPSEPAPVPMPAAAPVAAPSPKPRPAATTHRGSARYKAIPTDQPVVMPSSSSFGSSIEKVGMQFGSLSLGGGEGLFDAS